MKHLTTTIKIIVCLAVIGLTAYALLTPPVEEPMTNDCIEYSRDGSYCFRQTVDDN